MTTQETLGHLRQCLREAARAKGIALSEASELLGKHPHYLSRCLRGELQLKVVEVFQLLEVLGVGAEAFLTELFPFGRDRLGTPRIDGQAATNELQRLMRLERSRRGEHLGDPAAAAAKACRVLAVTLRRKKLSQPEASKRIGVRPHQLTAALYGGKRLTWELVFQVLEVADVRPGRFIFDLYGPPDVNILRGLAWSTHLTELEDVIRHLSED